VIGTTLSHFRIVAKIGQGGMGVVYRAEDTKLRRQVALGYVRGGPFMSLRRMFVLIVLTAFIQAAYAGEAVDLEIVHRIKDEAFTRSKAMDYLFHLTDLNGPRLAGSPGYRKAAEWAAGTLEEIGASGPGLEKWGSALRGWSFTRVAVQMKKPVMVTMHAEAQAWSAPTRGAVEANVMMAPLFESHDNPPYYDLENLADRIDDYIERYAGKLRGKIVLIDPARDFDLPTKPAGSRYDAMALDKMSLAPDPAPKEPIEWPIMSVPSDAEERQRFYDELNPIIGLDFWARERESYERVHAFLRDEGAAVVLMVNARGDGGVIFTDYRVSWIPGAPIPPPTVMLAPESYNRIVRLTEREIPVLLQVEVDAELIDEPVEGVNVVAEIPGSSKRDEVVMLGAHLDSWHAGTGATDNAAGCVVAMEAMRILRALDLKMDRTVRIALWDGEEQGFYGSLGYVKKHFGNPETMELKPEHVGLSVYFNLDSGSGKIRGVHLQQNDMARPIFEAWFAPFEDLGVDTITIRGTSLTDHHVFDALGLPGFQFIQDPLDYSTRTHHSNMDVYDHIQPGDLMQAAAVMASVVYHAATRDELMPRKSLPLPLPPKKKDG
jgi:hypothetical protein